MDGDNHDDGDRADVEAVLAGDPGRFGALVERHQGPVRAVLRGYAGDAATGSDDLAQEVFLRAWRALRTWKPRRGLFRTWLLAIARNLARDQVRRRGRRPGVGRLDGEPLAAPPRPAADRGGDLAGLDEALRLLGADRRVVFLLADVHGLPLAEIAAVEGIPVGTVKSRLDRARRELRAALQTPRTPDRREAP